MDFSSINWLAVVVCVVAAMAIGSVWYHPKVFFDKWWAVVGNNADGPGTDNLGLVMGMTVVASAVEAIVVALLLNAMGASTLASGVQTAFWLWLGLLAPAILMNKMFAGHGLKIWAIEAGQHLVTLLVFGAILGAWH